MKKDLIIFYCTFSFLANAQCVSNYTLPTGKITSLLTQSSTYIKTSNSTSQTTTLDTSVIKLDADPYNGYIELNPGFSSFPTTGAFIAQALDGCGTQSPSKNTQNNNYKIDIEDKLSIYPNPSNGIFYLKNNNDSDGTFEIYNILGQKIVTQKFIKYSVSEINLEIQASEMFFVKIVIDNNIILKKILKK